jgi:hypothetical protein
MAKKLYDSDYVLNLEYKVKLLEVTSAAQKERIKMLEKDRDFWIQMYRREFGIHTSNDKNTAKIIHM